MITRLLLSSDFFTKMASARISSLYQVTTEGHTKHSAISLADSINLPHAQPILKYLDILLESVPAHWNDQLCKTRRLQPSTLSLQRASTSLGWTWHTTDPNARNTIQFVDATPKMLHSAYVNAEYHAATLPDSIREFALHGPVRLALKGLGCHPASTAAVSTMWLLLTRQVCPIQSRTCHCPDHIRCPSNTPCPSAPCSLCNSHHNMTLYPPSGRFFQDCPTVVAVWKAIQDNLFDTDPASSLSIFSRPGVCPETTPPLTTATALISCTHSDRDLLQDKAWQVLWAETQHAILSACRYWRVKGGRISLPQTPHLLRLQDTRFRPGPSVRWTKPMRSSHTPRTGFLQRQQHTNSVTHRQSSHS